MNTKDAIKQTLGMADMVSFGYLEDLTDQEMMLRPCKGCNHINWQVGHIVAAEHEMMDKLSPGTMPPLPAGFAGKYTKETATSDDASKFCTKAELLATAKAQRVGTLAILDKTNDADFDKETGVEYAPTVGAMLGLQSSHWLMHAGQWAVVRRQTGRPPLF
jgi:hypothetical protein